MVIAVAAGNTFRSLNKHGDRFTVLHWLFDNGFPITRTAFRYALGKRLYAGTTDIYNQNALYKWYQKEPPEPSVINWLQIRAPPEELAAIEAEL